MLRDPAECGQSTLYVALMEGLLLGCFIASQEVLYLEEDHVLPGACQSPQDRGEARAESPQSAA